MSFQGRQTRSTSRSAKTEEETITLYVLECEDDCWYVGITGDLNRRWNQHRSGDGGAVWTKKHRPIRIHSECEVPNSTAALEENKFTARLMFKHGVNQVRGGSLNWGRPYTTSEFEVRLVAGFLRKALNLRFRDTKQWVLAQLTKDASDSSPVSVATPSTHHNDGTADAVNVVANQLTSFNLSAGASSSVANCDRCGRSTHTRAACNATRHIRGWQIWNSGCERCGRDSHSAASCYATTNKRGDTLASSH